MPQLSELVVDLYGALTYKPAFQGSGRGLLATSWVNSEHERRLRAYTVLRSYLLNMSRYLLEHDGAQKDRREYGDPSLFVETVVAAILGEETTINVQGARQTGDEVDQVADQWQDWFDAWEDDERPMMAIEEGETDAVGLGDALYEVVWDAEKRRPRVNVYDPGTYFPVIEEDEPADFVRRLHVAWEYEEETYTSSGYRKDKYVRRITWELVPVRDLEFEVDDEGFPLYDTSDQAPPWAPGEPMQYRCLKTDATWAWDDLGDRKANDFDLGKAQYRYTPYVPPRDGRPAEMPRAINRMDLGIDFIPVVHEPNTINRKEHFGTSFLALLLQLFDDLQGADTDLKLASRIVGTPPLAAPEGVKTSDGKSITHYGPGQLFTGDVKLIDTSKALDPMMKYVEHLLHRLTVNAQLSDAALGRVDPGEVEAGIILSLSFGPMSRLVKKMRQVRKEKHPLILKFVARYAQLYRDQAPDSDIIPLGPIPKVELVYGRFMPLDRAAVVTEVTTLYGAKVISRLTAVQRLIEQAGYDIEDAEAEVERIEHEDFEGANTLHDAIGPDAAADYLGRQAEEDARQVTEGNGVPVNLPPAGGQPTPGQPGLPPGTGNTE